MKIAFRIFIWIAISITVQIAGLFYANNYLFSADTSIKTKKVVKTEVKKPDPEVKVPENAKHINVSFDAKFLAYYDGDVLKVVNTKTGEEKNVEFRDGVKVSFYKWLPDRNRMLIAEKESSRESSNLKLAYYDVDKDLKEDIKELDWADKKAEVEDIQASPLTNVIYVKVATGKKSNIYWINIMKEMKKVDAMASVIDRIRVVPHDDKLVYEDSLRHKIYVTGEDEPLTINGVTQPSLLAVDDNDVVYIGETQGDSVSKIYYGSIKENRNALQTVNLTAPANKEDIYINPQGKIYINDNFKGTVKEFGSGKEYKYSGNFIQMYTDGIISISDGKLVKTLFN